MANLQEFRDCCTLQDYIFEVSKIEGYRSVREFLCNYKNNFGYSDSDIKFHMEFVYGIYYSVHTYRVVFGQYYYSKVKRGKPKRRVDENGFKNSETHKKYLQITRRCLGYSTFREAIYQLRMREGLNLRQISDLYGVSLTTLIYRVKMLDRSKNKGRSVN